MVTQVQNRNVFQRMSAEFVTIISHLVDLALFLVFLIQMVVLCIRFISLVRAVIKKNLTLLFLILVTSVYIQNLLLFIDFRNCFVTDFSNLLFNFSFDFTIRKIHFLILTFLLLWCLHAFLLIAIQLLFK